MAELKLTKSNFEAEVLHADKPVLVDFWAAWCGPCKMLSPMITELAEKYDGKIKVGKVNIDEEMELASAYQIVSIPTLLYFKNGQIEKRQSGLLPRAELEKMVL